MKKENAVFVQIRKYWSWYIAAALLVALDGYATYCYPKVLSRIIDEAIPSGDSKLLIVNILWMALYQFISISVALALSYLFCKISNSLIINIKNKLIYAMFQVKGQELQNKSNMFMTSMSTDISNIEMFASKMMADFVLQVLTVIITAFILIKINPVIFYFMLGIYPVLIIVQTFFNKVVKKQIQKVMKKTDIGNGFVKEFVTYIQEYIILNAKNYFLEKFQSNEIPLRKDTLKYNMLAACNRTVPQVISTSVFLIILAISGIKAINGEIQTGQLTIIILYTQRMFNPLSSIMLVIGQMQKARVSVDRINDIIG